MFIFLFMKMTLAQRLQKIMADNDINQVELAGVAGCTKGRINQILRDADPSEEMAARYGFKIAARFGYEPLWVMLGEGPIQNISSLNHRVEALLHNYAKCDERGRETVLIVAEREAQYNKDA
jgi:transcriptional regulator with XRE-family HTH domain